MYDIFACNTYTHTHTHPYIFPTTSLLYQKKVCFRKRNLAASGLLKLRHSHCLHKIVHVVTNDFLPSVTSSFSPFFCSWYLVYIYFSISTVKLHDKQIITKRIWFFSEGKYPLGLDKVKLLSLFPPLPRFGFILLSVAPIELNDIKMYYCFRCLCWMSFMWNISVIVPVEGSMWGVDAAASGKYPSSYFSASCNIPAMSCWTECIIRHRSEFHLSRVHLTPKSLRPVSLWNCRMVWHNCLYIMWRGVAHSENF